MTPASARRGFYGDVAGSTAVEFALISMLFISLMLGSIDMARFAWEFNAQKGAARAGARYAATHPPVVTQLVDFNAVTSCSLGGGVMLTTGMVPDYTCTSTGSTASCTISGANTCSVGNTASTTNFDAIVNYMRQFNPRISAGNVSVSYKERGLGVAGNPYGTDVSPLITVSLRNMTFRPIALRIFGVTLNYPSVATTLTAEDLS